MSLVSELHIVEPTLRDQTGHCCSLMTDILRDPAAKKLNYHLWIHRQAKSLFAGSDQITEHYYFSRRGRRLEALRLYRKLISKQQSFFISTATTTDLVLLHWAYRLQTKSSVTQQKLVKLYIHWMYRSTRKMKRLKKIAQYYPELSLACPTQSVQEILIEAGFKSVELIPYPSAHAEDDNNSLQERAFEKLLFAGAARVDKGFPLMVELVSLLKNESNQVPITLQCSTTHKGEYSEEVRLAIQRLEGMGYSNLTLMKETLDRKDYQEMLVGSVVMQPYNSDDFADRVSGVTLDALKSGSPVIVPAGTWMARIVDRYKVGMVVNETNNANSWMIAAQTVMNDWCRYANNVEKAKQAILLEHSPSKLINWLQN